MAVVNIYSKRQKALRGEAPDVYSYDDIPLPLKVQIIHIWRGTLGDSSTYHRSTSVRDAYQNIAETLRREYGVFELPGRQPKHGNHTYVDELEYFLLAEQDFERVLDAVELSFEYINRRRAGPIAHNAIRELNARFQEHGVGYQFEAGEIIRIDSQLLHAEVVRPALALLHDPQYQGAEEEFLAAHEHYRHGRKKEALNDALKAFESVMKSICAKRTWTYDPNAQAKTLLQNMFDNGLIEPMWSSHFSGLRSALEAGVPTARNKLGGHGQGPTVVEVPQHIVSYVLHLTASAIVFLVEAEKALP